MRRRGAVSAHSPSRADAVARSFVDARDAAAASRVETTRRGRRLKATGVLPRFTRGKTFPRFTHALVSSPFFVPPAEFRQPEARSAAASWRDAAVARASGKIERKYLLYSSIVKTMDNIQEDGGDASLRRRTLTTFSLTNFATYVFFR